jgi:hypothetical protein
VGPGAQSLAPGSRAVLVLFRRAAAAPGDLRVAAWVAEALADATATAGLHLAAAHAIAGDADDALELLNHAPALGPGQRDNWTTLVEFARHPRVFPLITALAAPPQVDLPDADSPAEARA